MNKKITFVTYILHNFLSFDLFLLLKVTQIFCLFHRYADISDAPIGHIAYVRKCIVALFLCIFYFWHYWCAIMVWTIKTTMLHPQTNGGRDYNQHPLQVILYKVPKMPRTLGHNCSSKTSNFFI